MMSQPLPQVTQSYNGGQHPQPVPQVTYTASTQPKSAKNVRPIPGVKFFAIATMAIAFLMCILGIAAIVIEAGDSYLGNPIWTGILFVLPTGILGMASYMKRNSTCTNVAYLVLTIITCIVCFQLMFYMSIMASRETWSHQCDPWPGYHYYDYWYDDYADACQFDWRGRAAVNALIALLAFAQLVLCIVSLSFICYGTFHCCYNCCRPAPPPAVIQYTAQDGTCQLISVGGHQTPGAYQPVSLMVPVGEGAGQTNPTGQGPPQPVLIPASPAQIQVIQQPMHVAPVPPSAPDANGTTVPNETKQPSETSQQQPQTEVAVSYGQTVSDEFHDQKNLLETD